MAIAPSFPASHVTQDAISRPPYDCKTLQIGILKDREELLKMGK
jgi:hypothetical protein